MDLVVRIAENAFIALFLFLAWSWNVPETHFLRKLVDRLAAPARWLGIWHAWSMFARGGGVNRRVFVKMRFADGTRTERVVWDPTQLGKIEAFLRVRDRKFMENMCGKKFKHLRPAFCEHLVHEALAEGREPVRVVLYQVKTFIPRFGASPAERARQEERSVRHVLWRLNREETPSRRTRRPRSSSVE